MKLRVILLEKITSLNKGCFEYPRAMPDTTMGPWIVLGHFDAMYTYELPIEASGVLGAICSNNQSISKYNSEHSYFHPLYLLSNDNDSEFWDEGKHQWFMAVVRIHYADTIDTMRFRQMLEIHLRQDATDQQCQLSIYQTVELSDLLLVVNSNCVRNLLNFVLSLRKHDCIGKVYTYCGISYNHMSQNNLAIPNKDDVIPSVSIRFAVSNFEKACNQVNSIKLKLKEGVPYSVVGVDDIALNCRNLPVSDLISLLRYYFLPSDEGFSLSDAFFDMTTRVGINFPNECNIVNYDKLAYTHNTKLREACQRIVNVDTKIQSIVHDEQFEIPYDSTHSWLRPLSELTKSLLRMSHTPVLDEFVYLMLPGATSFLQNTYFNLNNNHSLPAEDVSGFQRFIEDWIHLMEHIMRLEGQLTHHPDMRPIIYDIPVVMLEYTLAFLENISNILRFSDTNPRYISFLLVPRLCKRINALELFVAGKDISGLILVDIPLHMLYEPNKVLSALAHETSHFVGETYRNRLYRKECVIEAAAILLAKSVFSSYHQGLIETIIEMLTQEIPDSDGNIKNEIRRIEGNICRWVENLLTERNTMHYADFVRKVLSCNKTENRLSVPTDSRRLKDVLAPGFYLLLHDLCYLFREVYADICMMYLLPLEEEFYIDNLITELSIGKREQSSYEQYATRIYVCLTASGRCIPEMEGKYDNSNDEDLKMIYKEIKKINDNINGLKEPTDRLIPIGSIKALCRYAQKCYCTLKNKLEGSTQVDEVKVLFNAICNQWDYNAILNTINSYRKQLIDMGT